MGAVAIGGGHRMDEQGFPRSVEPCGLGEIGVEGEIAEPRAGGEILGEGAANRSEDRVGGRSEGAETVGSAALDDEDEAPIGGRLRDRDARRREQGDGPRRAGEEGPAVEHLYLLRNSGETSNRARPWAGLSARAIACSVACESAPGRIRGASWRASI